MSDIFEKMGHSVGLICKQLYFLVARNKKRPDTTVSGLLILHVFFESAIENNNKYQEITEN